MSLRVLSANAFGRSHTDGKTTFATFASDHKLQRGPDSFLLEDKTGQQHLFRLTSTERSNENETISWRYRNNFYGDKVEAVIFND